MKGYKAFNKNMTCKGFKYEIGKTYEEPEAVICDRGFHFCENPLDILNYYNLCDSEFAEVEAKGKIVDNDDDSKHATTKIKIKTNLDLAGFVKASVDFLMQKTKGIKDTAASGYKSKLAASGDYSQLAASGDFSQLAASGDNSKLAASGDYSKLAASGYYSKLAASGDYSKLAASGDKSKLAASGDYSQLAASGDKSQLAASGDYSKLAASGYYSQLAASGDYSQLAASGYKSQLAMSGKDSVGAAIGIGNSIKGQEGDWITLAEWEWDNKKDRHVPLFVKSAKIDGKKLKTNTFYKLENKRFVEA